MEKIAHQGLVQDVGTLEVSEHWMIRPAPSQNRSRGSEMPAVVSRRLRGWTEQKELPETQRGVEAAGE